MATIQAWQHIYSNVEKEQSPQGRGGFQTLFYSKAGLTEVEIEEMEGRLLYFASSVEPAKRLFFTTSTGKGVVAQVVSIPSPDRYGRGGRYLAHSLVFAPETLLQFEVDPFRVFRQFSFVTTVAEALAQGEFRTGDIGPVSLELPSTLAKELPAAKTWPVPELKKLAMLALRVEEQAQERNAITVTGAPEQILEALEAAFVSVPLRLRPGCSFDSYFYRCNLVATYFWATGLPEPPVSVKFAHIDGQARRVQGETLPQPETTYENWVMQTIESGNLNELVRYRDNAFALGAWLDGQEYDLSLLNGASSELIVSVFKSSPVSVEAGLRRRIASKLPPSLVERTTRYIYRHVDELTLYRQLRQGIEMSQLLEALYRSYEAERFGQPARQELKALAELLEKNEHSRLALFVAYWNSPDKELPKALKWAQDADYRYFVETALELKLVEPLKLLFSGRGESFLDVYLKTRPADLVKLTEGLIEVEEVASLSRLTGYMPKLPAKELKKIEKIIEDQAEIPLAFKKTVAEAIAALPPDGGLKGLIKSVWRRLPGQD